VFVANPKKPPVITAILAKNKDRLIVFLKDFHNDRDGGFPRGDPAPAGVDRTGMHHLLKPRIDAKPPTDEQFSDEKAYLIAQSEECRFYEYPPHLVPIANQRLEMLSRTTVNGSRPFFNAPGNDQRLLSYYKHPHPLLLMICLPLTNADDVHV
jgi:hypothetical protein